MIIPAHLFIIGASSQSNNTEQTRRVSTQSFGCISLLPVHFPLLAARHSYVEPTSSSIYCELPQERGLSGPIGPTSVAEVARPDESPAIGRPNAVGGFGEKTKSVVFPAPSAPTSVAGLYHRSSQCTLAVLNGLV